MMKSNWTCSTTTAPMCRFIPKFQEYFRKYQPPTLIVWGKNDFIFPPEGAEPYKRDLPKAKIIMYDTGHFALETHSAEIGKEIRSFLSSIK